MSYDHEEDVPELQWLEDGFISLFVSLVELVWLTGSALLVLLRCCFR